MPAMLKAYRRSIPLWLIPMLYVGVTLVGGLVLPRLEQEYLAGYSHAMSVASALATLSAIASGMLALTGIVFAIAFVMVQFSAVAYSPRLVIWLSHDPILFNSLGLFTATFSLCDRDAGLDRSRGERQGAPVLELARYGSADPQPNRFCPAGAAAELD